MKNVQVLTNPDDISGYVRRLWRTDEFRQSHDDGGIVRDVVDKLATLPRYFYERSDDRAEMGHFTSWWGGIQLRPNDYEKDAVHDLYYFHEMFHAATMPACPGLQYGMYTQKVGNNEGDASVYSEILAYFAMPTLRQKSFQFTIYVDQFLNDPVYRDMWRRNRAEFVDTMKYMRRNVMSADYTPKNTAEEWIHRFADQNRKAGAIWKDRYDEVEQAMWRLRRDCIDQKLGPIKAMDNFMEWVTSDAVTKGTDIPFPDEAHAFADIYWQAKEAYIASTTGRNAGETTQKFNSSGPLTRPP